MTALTQPVRDKMFGFLKTFVRKLVAETPAENVEFSAMPAPAEPPMDEAGAPSAPRAVPQARTGYAGPQNGKGVQLPLQTILATLPLELQPKVRRAQVGDRTVPVPLAKILAQLSRGGAPMSFG